MIKNEDFLKATWLARDYPKDNFALFYGEFKMNFILFTFFLKESTFLWILGN